MCDILKRAGRRAKRSEIWDSGTLVIYMCCTFDLVVFKVILVSFGAPCLKIAHNSLVVELNGVKFESRGQLLYIGSRSI